MKKTLAVILLVTVCVFAQEKEMPQTDCGWQLQKAVDIINRQEQQLVKAEILLTGALITMRKQEKEIASLKHKLPRSKKRLPPDDALEILQGKKKGPKVE